VSRPLAATANPGADRRNRGDDHGACNCHDGCNGLGGSEQCRGNADGGAHATSPDDCPADAYNAFTVSRLDYLTNRDTGDEDSHA
jgi:hypothetical protein